jgi:hypothetical protein
MPMRWILCVFLGFSSWAVAQVPAQPASSVPAPVLQLSPEAAYQQALRPFDLVRKSMGNWSDSEVGGFAQAMKNARVECLARSPEGFSGEDLISFAKLCSLGQQWVPMGVAAGLYLDAKDGPKPQLSTAYGYKLEAAIHAQDRAAILDAEKSMLEAVPYDSVVDAVTAEALAFLQLPFPQDALALDRLREPVLLAELKREKPLLAKHALYETGLGMAALEQYAADPAGAGNTVAALNAALGTSLEPDDEIPIEISRRRYGVLGQKLPAIYYELSLKDVRETPHINHDMGAATALLLFPDWCAQCVRQAPEIWDAMSRLGPSDIRVYGLVAEPTPDKAALLVDQMKPMTPPAANAPPRSPSEILLHTPVLVVPVETLKTFGAEDFPFLIVADHAGVVRFAGAAPETVMEEGGFLDWVAPHVAETWPGPKRTAANARGISHTPIRPTP